MYEIVFMPFVRK